MTSNILVLPHRKWPRDFKRCCLEPDLEISHSVKVYSSVKLQMFDSLILSIIVYNVETWTTAKPTEREIDSHGTSSYCCILGRKRLERMRNDEVLKGVRSNVSNLLYKRQLRSLGHWIRKDGFIADYASCQAYHTRGEERHSMAPDNSSVSITSSDLLFGLL